MDYYDNRTIPPGRPLPVVDILSAENALIEEVMASTGDTGYVLISYEALGQDNQTYVSEVRLNVGRNTVIMDENGSSLSMYDLMDGMRVDAEFSAVMTRSLPPQSNAFRIVVLEGMPSVNVTTDRVVGIDVDHGFLLTGNPNDMYDQTLFTISDQTVILDRDGNPMELDEIQPGQLVRVEHATFQTASIPPQTPAYFIQLL